MDANEQAEAILSDLYNDWFHEGTKKELIKKALISILGQDELSKQVEHVSECFEAFWRDYSNDHLATVLKNFPKVEFALYGLLREGSGRYRDHYIHMFNNFIFGGQLLSKIIAKCDTPTLENLLKVQPEPGTIPNKFTPYSAEKRMFFIWTLITNFHDVAIPIQHFQEIINGLNKYLKHFGFKITDYNLKKDTSLELNIQKYFKNIARIFSNGVKPKDGIYEQDGQLNPYFYKALCEAYEKSDHGVLASISLFKNIEDTFFHRSDRYKLDLNEFPSYYDFILTQDIARAALDIALHNFKKKDYGQFFPFQFTMFPLAFLLVLCDEIQEFMRPEGLSYQTITKFKTWPSVYVDIINTKIDVSIEINIKNNSLTEQEIIIVLKQLIDYFEKNKRGIPFITTEDDEKDLKEATTNNNKEKGKIILNKYFEWYWSERNNIITEKLRFSSDDPICLHLKIISGSLDDSKIYNHGC
ncbi:MAG: hypothetical protein HZA77_02190 [Candidatus Schekmanbacteria bacterium]|nr:hypothetical protein [Candidatus Schekmanbacteria bacterium]